MCVLYNIRIMSRRKKRINEEDFDLDIIGLKNPEWTVRSKRLTDKQKKFLELETQKLKLYF